MPEKAILTVNDFDRITEEFIIQTFDNYHKAQIAYLNSVIIKKLASS